MMIKKTILFTLGLFFGLGIATAQVRQNVFGVELGSHNTALYDLSLGRHFSVSTRAGFGLGLGFSTKKDAEGKRVAFGGIIPFANVEPRWHFSSKSTSDVYHTGGYLSLRFGADWDRITLFGPSYPKGYDRPQYTLSFGPYFGWVFSVTDNSYIRLSAGIDFFRTKMSYSSGGHYWRSNNTESLIPIGLEMVYGIRF